MKKIIVLCILGLIVLSVANTASIGAPPEIQKEKGDKKCNDDIDNDMDGFTDGDDPDCGGEGSGDPTIGVCDVYPCITSVGKWHGTAASDYVISGGTYTELSSNAFARILAAALDANSFSDMCLAHDVLIFNWDSPNIKRLDWPALVSYMNCGGDVIWEDTKNIVKLSAGVAIDAIINHDKTAPSPAWVLFDLTFCPPIPAGPDLPLCNSLPAPPAPPGTGAGALFPVVNNHIEFRLVPPQPAPQLMPFLRQDITSGPVLGLWGDFGSGCIVFTGPDNNFHGVEETTPLDPYYAASNNQYNLLHTELDWVLSLACE